MMKEQHSCLWSRPNDKSLSLTSSILWRLTKMAVTCLQTGKYTPILMISEDRSLQSSSYRYMRICGFAAEGLRSERMIHETFPSKELQDYWSTRPHYEDAAEASASSSGNAESSGDEERKYQDWLKTQKDDKDELPPPPYSLEAGETENAESELVVSTQPALSENILTSVPERTSSPVQVEPMVSQVETGSISSVVQGLTLVTQSPAISQGPPPINPLSRPLSESTNTHQHGVDKLAQSKFILTRPNLDENRF
jgi:hypothetical protein